jgi:wyosine [tRNA(Phe)-imidazoG37] synthetase (radical SAM superfamily)
MRAERQVFYAPDELVRAVRGRVKELRESGEEVDYLAFVPDGEPTLDVHLGEEIAALKVLGISIAVISNASLVSLEGVRDALSRADWVSLKVDAATEAVWKRINRPHRSLSLEGVQEGILEFARRFRGTLTTETMLVWGINDSPEELAEIARFLTEVKPAIAYIAVPTRPPAEPWVKPPPEGTLARAYAIFAEELPRVELLIGYEGDAFSATGDAAADILSITAVHPLREEALRELLARDGASWEVVERLIASGELVEREYQGHRFYLRRLPSAWGEV